MPKSPHPLPPSPTEGQRGISFRCCYHISDVAAASGTPAPPPLVGAGRGQGYALRMGIGSKNPTLEGRCGGACSPSAKSSLPLPRAARSAARGRGRVRDGGLRPPHLPYLKG